MSKPQPTEIQFIQFLDRIILLSENLDNHLLQHPVCKLEKEITKSVEEAAESLLKARIILNQIVKK